MFDGEDITDLGPIERVGRGIVMVPAKAIFASLTVRREPAPRRLGAAAIGATRRSSMHDRRVFELFPILEQRARSEGVVAVRRRAADARHRARAPRPAPSPADRRAVARPRTDRRSRRSSTSSASSTPTGLPIVVVEQSLNVSCDDRRRSRCSSRRAQVRFAGPTAELVARDDIVQLGVLRVSSKTGAPASGRKDRAARRASKRARGRAACVRRERRLEVVRRGVSGRRVDPVRSRRPDPRRHRVERCRQDDGIRHLLRASPRPTAGP